MKNITIAQEGLQPIPAHLAARIASHAKVVGAAPLSELPETFDFMPDFVKDQTILDFCGTFAGSAVSEVQEGVEIDPLSLFAWAKEIVARESSNPDAYLSYGLNLLDVANALIQVGGLPMEYAPYTMEQIADHERNFLANPASYPQELKELASEHRKASVLNAASGDYDLFDNIRSTIWLNRMSRQTVLTGSLWYKDWVNASVGIIPKAYSNESLGGHAYKICGWETLEDGQPWLIIQNSWGKDIGDGGMFYMSRETANKELTYGCLVFNDLPQEVIDYHSENDLKLTDSPIYKLFRLLLNAFLAFLGVKN